MNDTEKSIRLLTDSNAYLDDDPDNVDALLEADEDVLEYIGDVSTNVEIATSAGETKKLIVL